MSPEVEHRSAYVPPTVEVESMMVEEGFADSITESWQNSFSVEPTSEANKVDLLLWTDQTKTTPTNANEQFDIGFSNSDFWGI